VKKCGVPWGDIESGFPAGMRVCLYWFVMTMTYRFKYMSLRQSPGFAPLNSPLGGELAAGRRDQKGKDKKKGSLFEGAGWPKAGLREFVERTDKALSFLFSQDTYICLYFPGLAVRKRKGSMGRVAGLFCKISLFAWCLPRSQVNLLPARLKNMRTGIFFYTPSAPPAPTPHPLS